MTVKEKVIREAIRRCEKKINQIEQFLTADPIGDWINLRKQVGEYLDTHPSPEELDIQLAEYAKEEARLLHLSKRQQKYYMKKMYEQCEIKSELSKLHDELSILELRKKDGWI